MWKHLLQDLPEQKFTHVNAHLKQLRYLSSGEILLCIVDVHIYFGKTIDPVALSVGCILLQVHESVMLMRS